MIFIEYYGIKILLYIICYYMDYYGTGGISAEDVKKENNLLF